MTTFTLIILILFVTALSAQFTLAMYKGCLRFGCLFAFEVLAFAYLAQQLM